MRTILGFLFTVLSGLWVAALAQPDTLWTQRIQIGYSVVIYGAIELSDGGFALAGSSSRDGTTQDMFVAKLSANGQLVWERAYGYSDSTEQANSVVETIDGNLMLIGQCASSAQSPSRTLALMGVSSQGDSLWTRFYPAAQGQRKGLDGTALADGSVAIVGYKLGTDNNHSDLWLLKVTSTGDSIWTRLFGGTDTDTGSRILLRAGSGFLLAGQTKSTGQGDYDFWLVQTDADGNQTSSDTYGTANIDKCNALAIGNGNSFLGGRTQDAGGHADGYLVKRSAAGQALWARAYDTGMDEEQISGVASRPGGGAVCVGWAGPASTNVLPWVFRVNDEGTLEQSWVDSAFQQGQYYGIRPVSNGGYLVWGVVSAAGTAAGFAMKYAPTGEVRGTVTEQSSGHTVAGAHVSLTDRSLSAVTNARGLYSLELVPGTYDIMAWGPCVSRRTMPDVHVVLDSAAALDITVGSPEYECEQSSINLVVHNHEPLSTPLTISNRGTGEMEFSITAEPDLPPNTDWLSVEPDHGFVPAGDSVSVLVQVSADTTDDGVYDYYGYVVVRTSTCPDSADRIPVFVSVLDAPEGVNLQPRVFSLHPAYPNPFNPLTTISYSVPCESHVRLAVYDLTGREVKMLVNSPQQIGLHRVAFDGETLASGVYFVRMQSTKFTAMQKMILLK